MIKKTRFRGQHAAIERLNLPSSVPLPDLVARVEDLRGFKIHLVESEKLTTPGLCGLWGGLRDGSEHALVMPKHAPLAQKVMVVGHELGHMVAEPGTPAELEFDAEINAVLAEVLPTKRLVAYAHHRGAFEHPREAAAEEIGSELALRVLRSLRSEPDLSFQFGRVFGRAG